MKNDDVIGNHFCKKHNEFIDRIDNFELLKCRNYSLKCPENCPNFFTVQKITGFIMVTDGQVTDLDF